MNAIKSVIFVLPIVISACATPGSKNSKAWEDLRKSEAYQNEKAAYTKRLGDRAFCWGMGIDEFLQSSAPKPDTKCIYPASKFVIQYGDAGLVKARVLGQAFKQLKVLQVTPTGFVIQSPNFRNDQVIYVHKTDEADLVDGSLLDEAQNFKLYEYVGTYSYQTLAGSKTVYSFRKVNKKLGEVRKDIKYYDPLREFLIENQLWENLGELPKN